MCCCDSKCSDDLLYLFFAETDGLFPVGLVAQHPRALKEICEVNLFEDGSQLWFRHITLRTLLWVRELVDECPQHLYTQIVAAGQLRLMVQMSQVDCQ